MPVGRQELQGLTPLRPRQGRLSRRPPSRPPQGPEIVVPPARQRARNTTAALRAPDRARATCRSRGRGRPRVRARSPVLRGAFAQAPRRPASMSCPPDVGDQEMSSACLVAEITGGGGQMTPARSRRTDGAKDPTGLPPKRIHATFTTSGNSPGGTVFFDSVRRALLASPIVLRSIASERRTRFGADRRQAHLRRESGVPRRTAHAVSVSSPTGRHDRLRHTRE